MASGSLHRRVCVAAITDLGATVTRVRFTPRSQPVPLAERVPGGHLKLFFPCNLQGHNPVARPEVDLCHKPRSFTYRGWAGDGAFDVDFARHEGTGPAANWIAQARVGDMLLMRHGGAPKLDPAATADPLVLVADPTGTPVVAALVESLADAVDVTICLAVEPGASPCALPRDHGQQVLVTSRDRSGHRLPLADLLRCAPIAPRARVFVACEAGEMRAIRRFLLDEAGHDPSRVITSGYWKAGLNTEAVEAAKRRPDWFADPAPAAPRHAEVTT
jgi:NADPH-dependent ferric siderophore reductase